jgi:multiple antibiotic resistance protein
MDAAALPWATLFGLMFMTMGPIRAIAVFSAFGESDHAPGVRPLAARSIGLVAAAFAVAALLGDLVLVRWGVDLPALVIAAGAIVFALSLQAMLSPPAPAAAPIDATRVPAASVAFPGLFPPIAVALPVIFAAAAPGLANKAGILGLGLAVLALDWLVMRHAKAIIAAIGPTPLQLLGAVFGVLQAALGVEFLLDGLRLLEADARPATFS